MIDSKHKEPSAPISVIMPARDAAATIASALATLAPDGRLLREVLIVDDGSIDDTANIASDFAKSSGLPISVIKAAAQGAAESRNLGVRQSTGEFLFFFDADDELIGGGLARLCETILSDDDLDLVLGGYIRRESGRGDRLRIPYGYRSDPAANSRCYITDRLRSIAMGSALVRRSTALRAVFPKDVVYDEDTIFWAAILSLAKVGTLADPIVIYNVDAVKMERRLVSAPHEAFQRFKLGLDGLVAYGIEPNALNWRKAFVALRIARAFIRLRDYSSAHDFLRIAVALDRRMRYAPRTLRYLAKVQAGKALSAGINPA